MSAVDFTDIPAYTDTNILDNQQLHVGGGVGGNASVTASPDAVKVLRLAALIVLVSVALLWLGAITFKG